MIKSQLKKDQKTAIAFHDEKFIYDLFISIANIKEILFSYFIFNKKDDWFLVVLLTKILNPIKGPRFYQKKLYFIYGSLQEKVP